MKKIGFIFFIGIIFLGNTSNAQTWQWAKALSDTGNLNLPGKIVVDKMGNTTAIGSYKGRLTLSPTNFILSNGDYDIYLVRYNDIGQVSWVKSLGGIGDDRGVGITIDSSGNVLISGRIAQTVSFGTQSIIVNGGGDIFIAKIDSLGNPIWARSYGGFDSNPFSEIANDICTDNLSNIYITGNFLGSNVDFGNGFSSTSAGSYSDFFVMKLDSNGTTQWIKRGGSYTGGFDFDEGKCITLASDQQSVLAGGFFSGPKFIYQGVDTILNYDIGTTDNFLISLDINNGSKLFIRSILSNSYNYLIGISTDISGNLYITGNCESVSFFSPSTTIAMGGVYKIFLFKYSSSGSFIWSKGLGNSTFGHSVSDVIVNNLNEIVLVGSFFVHLECDTFQVGGSRSGFIATLDSNGVCKNLKSQNLIWGFKTVGIDKFDNLYLQGSTQDTTSFGSIPFIYNMNAEIFVAKYGFNSLGTNIPNEFAEDNSFSVFPNPASNLININSSSEITQLQLFDVFGKLLVEQKSIHSTKVQLSTNSFSNGVYYIKLLSNNGIGSQQKVVVCR